MEHSPQLMDQLYQSIAQLKTPEEVQSFLVKLWNFSELRAMEQRIDMAVFLEQGREYLQVLERSGADQATINAIRSAMLEHGSGGMIEELLHREN